MQAYQQAFQDGATSAQDPRSAAFVEQFGDYVLAQNLVDKLRVRQAQLAQKESGERFDLVLMRLGLLTDAAMAKALAAYCGLPLVTSADFPPDALLADLVDVGFLKLNRLLPFADRIDHVAVAVSDPFNNEAIASLSYLIDRPVERCVVADGDLDSAIDRLYGAAALASAAPTGAEFSGSSPAIGAETASEEDVQRLEDMASEAPVIRLVQELIVRAVANQASDIHVEPREDSVRVRFRIDGVLQTVETLALGLRAALGSRIKIMARMNIAERRMPQDGRIKVNVRGREIDLRVSTMPTLWGESIVLRILDRSSVELDFPKLGFTGRGFDDLNLLLQQPNGIILVTGPTGSGKTTTLYTALSALNTTERKIFTVEDPIEYQLPGINQIQVQPKIGLTFAHALRSILRQDPDIIMVGEIRDLETAQMAVQASLTGHLVLSTVHTNSATATITRLLDMGVEKYLLTSTLKGVLAQRLVRRLCKACAEPSNDAASLMQMLNATGVKAETLMAGETPRPQRAIGCPACRQRGYSGRTTIYELLTTTPRMRETILSTTSEAVLEKAAVADRMTTMLQNGLVKALRGETTPEEVLRATRFDGELAEVAT
jgi:general secretion pathway protein E